MMGLFSNRETTLTRYIHVPTLYPMGALTFAVACSHCKNVNSDKCDKCKKEIESGFELNTQLAIKVDRCISCGEIIPEGRLMCPSCSEVYHVR